MMCKRIGIYVVVTPLFYRNRIYEIGIFVTFDFDTLDTITDFGRGTFKVSNKRVSLVQKKKKKSEKQMT